MFNRIPRFLRTTVLLSFLISFTSALVVIVFYFRLQPEIPLFYSLARKAQHLVNKEWLFIFPTLAFAISISHSVILRVAAFSDRLLVKLFAWSTVGIQVVLGLALLRIIIIIT